MNKLLISILGLIILNIAPVFSQDFAPDLPSSCAFETIAFSPAAPQVIGTQVSIYVKANCNYGVAQVDISIGRSFPEYYASIYGAEGTIIWNTHGFSAIENAIRIDVIGNDTSREDFFSDWRHFQLTPSEPQTTCPSSPTHLSIGDRASVADADPSPLNSRAQPGVEYEVVFHIPIRETVTIVNGPFCADGYRWYEIEYDFDDKRGWSAEVGQQGLYNLTLIEQAIVGNNTEVPSFSQATGGQLIEAQHLVEDGIYVSVYCQAKGYTDARFIEGDAYSWECYTENGEAIEIDFQQACREVYGVDRPFAILADATDHFGWRCSEDEGAIALSNQAENSIDESEIAKILYDTFNVVEFTNDALRGNASQTSYFCTSVSVSTYIFSENPTIQNIDVVCVWGEALAGIAVGNPIGLIPIVLEPDSYIAPIVIGSYQATSTYVSPIIDSATEPINNFFNGLPLTNAMLNIFTFCEDREIILVCP